MVTDYCYYVTYFSLKMDILKRIGFRRNILGMANLFPSLVKKKKCVFAPQSRSTTEYLPLGNPIGQYIFHKTVWLVFEWDLCVHASVDRAMQLAQDMAPHCTIRFWHGLTRQGKQVQSQVILGTKTALCTATTLLAHVLLLCYTQPHTYTAVHHSRT